MKYSWNFICYMCKLHSNSYSYCEVFLCFVAIVRFYYVDSFVFFVLRCWWVLQILTLRMNHTYRPITLNDWYWCHGELVSSIDSHVSCINCSCVKTVTVPAYSATTVLQKFAKNQTTCHSWNNFVFIKCWSPTLIWLLKFTILNLKISRNKCLSVYKSFTCISRPPIFI